MTGVSEEGRGGLGGEGLWLRSRRPNHVMGTIVANCTGGNYNTG